MRNPIEILGDLYDYHYEYYRWFIHRRLTFSDISIEGLKHEFGVSVFENNDSENVGKVVTTTTLIGFSAGASLASLKYLTQTQLHKKTMRQSLPLSLSILLAATGAGFVYGSVVNLTSRIRGNKNDYINHAVASFASVPISGYFAKANKVTWGFKNALYAALIAAYLKHALTNNIVIEETKKYQTKESPYKPFTKL